MKTKGRTGLMIIAVPAGYPSRVSKNQGLVTTLAP